MGMGIPNSWVHGFAQAPVLGSGLDGFAVNGVLAVCLGLVFGLSERYFLLPDWDRLLSISSVSTA
jgi:hypothetical protein